MALLLGELSYRTLEASKSSQDGPVDLEALLAGLPEPTRRRLEAQVADLEVFLRVQDGAPFTQAILAPKETDPARSPFATQGGAGVGTGSRSEWTVSMFDPPLADVAARILSCLTLPRWNQYTDLKFVGEGGMGRIFKAFDPTLSRPVALKFLRRVDPDRVTGLMEEARNQARVNHPNICKVFEAKEWQGQLYVAMQFIDGRNLDQVAPDLSAMEKVEIMEQVAEAMHAAHRQGLVHRDLKPANIMVERSMEGVYTPYILDFGLARDLGKRGETLDGTILGTTHYMAPEQARGEVALIGRRTDIYAMGVTLYELFAGAPPFQQVQGLECLHLILEAEIPPLQTVAPGVPLDLHTIIMKCLEKDISQRYESARALAEDLRRFRDGEPILARPTSFVYRAGKLAMKHRAFVSLGVVALVVAGALGAFGLHARLTASDQAQWAQHFGQEAERIEALLRYARLQPRHDIRAELAQVARRISAMENEVAGAGGRAVGPGNYALGRAYLALGDADRARTYLDQAWAAGFRVRDVSYARGRALGQLYVRGLRKARTLQDAGLRQARIQELEETLRDPAVALLQLGRGSTMEPASFQAGLLALYERQFDTALHAARDAAQTAPWFYESRALEAEVDLDRARLADDPAAADRHLRDAGLALAAAAATAPSDPNLMDLQSRRWWEEMIQRRREGLSLDPAFEAFRKACGQWREIVPGSSGPDARLAWGELERARVSVPGKRDESLRWAIDRAESVLRGDPDHAEALGALAAGLQIQAYAAMNSGGNPGPLLDRAMHLLVRVLQGENASFELFEPYAGALWARVEFEKIQGRDPAATVAEALAAIRGLARRYPKVADFEGFLGGIQVELADFQACHGVDPGPVAGRAMADLERAIRMAPARFDFRFSLGNAHLALAQYRLLEKQPASEPLAAAEAAYHAALECNSSAAGPRFGLGEVAMLRCQEWERQGRNPLAALAQAETVMAAARGLSDNWRTPLFEAQAALVRARWTSEPHEAIRYLALAETRATKALSQGGQDPTALVLMAEVQMAWTRLVPAEAGRRRLLAQRAVQQALLKDAGFRPAQRILVAGSGT